MREIKFRAWDKINHKWIDLSNFPLVIYSDGSGHILLERDSVHGDETLELNELIELTQFTGIKDKNGKEIYEGDIVGSGLHGRDLLVTDIRLDTLKLTRMIQFMKEHKTKDYFIVIGNKFENPGLLK